MKNKKSLFVLVLALLIISSISILSMVKASTAGIGGPDSFGYTYTNSNTPGGPVYNWVEISRTGTMINQMADSDDNYVSNIPVGFFFNFYGTDYSQITVGNNGILFSDFGSSQYTNQPIPTNVIRGFIAPFWDDLVTWNHYGVGGDDGAIYYQTLGTAPHRTFVVEWYNNQHFSSSPSGVTFEAILYEGTDNILFQYQDTNFNQPGNDNGGSATVGIESPNGDIGLQYSFNQPVITPNLAILFKFPAFQGTNMYLTMRGPASFDQGHRMTYTISYNNFGGDFGQNVVLQTALSQGVTFVSSANQDPAANQGTYDSTNNRVTWALGTLASYPNGRGSVSVTVDIPNTTPVGSIVTSTSSISTTTLETRYDDNSASVSTTVTGTNLPPNVGVGPLNGNSGTTPTVYWGNPITFTYTDPLFATPQQAYAVDIRIHVNDGLPDIVTAMNGPSTTGDWTYIITFLAQSPPRHGETTVTYTPHRPGIEDRPIQFTIYIDPAGYIYNAVTNARIQGATVWLQRPDGSGGWENVPTEQIPAIMQPDTNPLTTDINGQYQWFTLPGTYRVHVEASGYQPADSLAVNVAPPVDDLDVGLTPIPRSDNTPPVTTLTISNPKVVESSVTYITSHTAITLSALDSDSGVASTSYQVSSTTYNSGQMPYSQPFFLTGLPDGTYSLMYNSIDSAGNTETLHTTTLFIDNTAPRTTDNYDGQWHTSNLTVNLNAYDTGCGVDFTCYEINNGIAKFLGIDGQPLITTEGANNILTYSSVDKLGNTESPNPVLIKIDKTAPTGSIVINNGTALTNSPLVTLTLTANDSTSGISKIRINNSGVWTTEQWENKVGTKDWNLTSGDGAKTVYYQIQDKAGLTSPTYNASIILDTKAPITSNNYNGTWHTQDFTVNLSVDSVDVKETYYRINNGVTKTLSVNGQPLITTEGSNNTLEYWSVDFAGNQEPHQYLNQIKLDKTNPTANAGTDKTITAGDSVTLDGSGSQDTFGLTSYKWAFSDGSIATGITVTHTFTSLGSSKVILTVQDAAGNTGTATVTITVNPLSTPTPAPTTTTPTSAPTTPTPTPTPTASPSPTEITNNGNNDVSIQLYINGNLTSTQTTNATIHVDSTSSTTIHFVVTGPSGSTGVGNITIPKSQVPSGTAPIVYIDGVQAENQSYTQDSSNYYIWCMMHFSTHDLAIIFSNTQTTTTETSLWIIIAFVSVIFATVIAGTLLTLSRRKKQK